MILTLDPSLTAFGWAILDKSKYVAGGCIKTKKEKGLVVRSDHNRLKQILLVLISLRDQYKLTEVYYEVPGGSKGFRCAQALAAVRGVVLGFCVASGLKYHEVRVGDLREALLGNKNATKDEILVYVKQKIPTFTTKTMDEATIYAVSDALAVYLGEKSICSSPIKSTSVPKSKRSKA
jgi:Holliday junction resolvasome RuvABC endonuclease subunit